MSVMHQYYASNLNHCSVFTISLWQDDDDFNENTVRVSELQKPKKKYKLQLSISSKLRILAEKTVCITMNAPQIRCNSGVIIPHLQSETLFFYLEKTERREG